LRLLGGLALIGPDGLATGKASQRRRLAVLAALAVARGRPVSRDKLIALLWAENNTERGRHMLADSLYVLRAAIGKDALITTGDDIALDEARLASDFREFLAASESRDYKRAVDIYAVGGPFLDGVHISDAPEFEQWSESVRAELRQKYREALEALARDAAEQRRHTDAIAWWRRLAAEDRLNSRVAIELMRALADAGDRAGALDFARLHENIVQFELEVPADPAIAALVATLRSQPILEPPPASTPPAQPEGGPAVIDPTPISASASIGHRWRPIVIAGALMLLAAAGMIVRLGPRISATSPPSRAPNSIVVLPFVNVQGDSADDYLADGLTDELINSLAKIRGFRVVPRSSAFTFKSSPQPAKAVAAELGGVSTVVEGTVRRADGRVRVTAEVVDVRTNSDLRSVSYDRPEGGMFQIQDELATAIVAAVRGALTPKDATVFRSGTDDPRAYDLFLRGRYFASRFSKEDLLRGIDLYQQAIARDPRFARPWAGIAEAWENLADDWVLPRNAYPKAEEAARRAISLDSTLAGAHAALGAELTYYRRDFQGALDEGRRALELDSSSVVAHLNLALVHSILGHRDSARLHANIATRLDPLSASAHVLASRVLGYVGLTDEALAEQMRANELMGPLPGTRLRLAYRALLMGRPRLADSLVHAACDSRAPQCSAPDLRVIVLLARHDTAAVRQMVALRTGQTNSARLYFTLLAANSLMVGDTLLALDDLDKANERREAHLNLIAVESVWNPLRHNPRFRALIRELGLADVQLR